MKHIYPDPRAVFALQLLVLTLFTILCFGIKPLFALFSIPLPTYPFLIPLFLLTVALVFVIIPLWMHRLSYTISDTAITMTSGVFLIRTKTILLRSLQFSTLVYTPLAKFIGFYFLPLHAYGGSMVLMFLRQQDAADLCASLYASLYRSQSTAASMEDSHVSS